MPHPAPGSPVWDKIQRQAIAQRATATPVQDAPEWVQPDAPTNAHHADSPQALLEYLAEPAPLPGRPAALTHLDYRHQRRQTHSERTHQAGRCQVCTDQPGEPRAAAE